ncbi:MAG: hypothetical protein IKB34_07740 [Clostridia bacterium]|nr:hypothetical protein [Clostridia bacterium]
MKTLAHKKISVGIMYILLAILGAFFIAVSVTYKNIQFGMMGTILAAVCTVLSIQFLLLPSDVIVLSGDNTLILPKGIAVPLSSVVEVSYKCARGKGIRYRWGTVILSTYLGRFKLGFVADCSDVAEEICRLADEANKQNQ